jgi:hypothetical protein
MPANMGDNIPKLAGRYINTIVLSALITFRSIIILERSIMFIEPNVELVFQCVTLLIEISIRSDLTEMLRPYRLNAQGNIIVYQFE